MKRFLAGLGMGLAAGLFVGLLLGVDASSPPAPAVRVETPPARPAATASTSSTDAAHSDAPEVRPHRGRVVRPDPVSRPKPPAETAPTPAKPPPPTAEEMTALVRSALAEEIAFDEIRDEGQRFRDARAGNDIPIELVLAVLTGVTDVDSARAHVARSLATHVTGDDAVDALLAATRGSTPDERRPLLVAYTLSERAMQTERTELATLASGLLADPVADVRWAGLNVAASLESPPVPDLERIATSDPEPELRYEARSHLVYSEDPTVRAAGSPLVTSAAMSGTLDERWEAIDMLSELGPEGADAALAILREGGLGWDERETLVHVALSAGRVRELFAAASGTAHLEHVATWIGFEDLEGATFDALVPYLPAIVDAVDADTATSVLYEAAARARYDVVRELALREDVDASFTRYAVETLLEGTGPDDQTDDDGVSADAQRRGAELVRRLLRPNTPPSVRRAVVDLLYETGFDFADPETAAHIEVTLRRTAAGDPNAWVRLAAEEALADMLDLEE